MIRTLSAKTCAFDCEWVPCPDTVRRLLALAPETSEREAMEAAWAAYRKPDDDPAARPFLKLVLSKVVSIAAVFRTVDGDGAIHLFLRAHGVDEMGEGEMIGRFLEGVADKGFQLWGYNSANADLPILVQRAIALGVPCPAFSQRSERYRGKQSDTDGGRYDYHDSRYGEGHKDILEIVGGYGAGPKKPKLHEFAVACGFPGKLDVDGAEVADLYLDGRIREIVEYNETDAVTTHLLMLRVGLHTGQLDPDRYAAEVEAVGRLVAEQAATGKGQMAKFAAAWGAMGDAQVTQKKGGVGGDRPPRTAR